MITTAKQEPRILDPDDEGIADAYTDADFKDKARQGSRNLRNAILMAHGFRVTNRKKRGYGQRDSWEDRLAKFEEIRRVQQVVARHFGLPREAMLGWRGKREITEKRQVAMYLAREIVGSSYPDIARCFGGKDHTTIIHGCNRAEANPDLADDIAKLRERLSK